MIYVWTYTYRSLRKYQAYSVCTYIQIVTEIPGVYRICAYIHIVTEILGVYVLTYRSVAELGIINSSAVY